MVLEEEDGTPCTHRRDCDTSDVLYSSRRFSGQSFEEPPGSRAAAKPGTGLGIKIRTTELSNVDEQTEELLTGVQWDTFSTQFLEKGLQRSFFAESRNDRTEQKRSEQRMTHSHLTIFNLGTDQTYHGHALGRPRS